MARRIGLPAHIRAELPQRCSAGHGHDWDAPCETPSGTIPARDAVLQEPSKQMLDLVKQVREYVLEQGALHATVQPCPRAEDDAVGAVQVLWTGGDIPTALSVAEHFAVSHDEDGTPRVPGWLSLVADGDFDLRWQYPL